MSIAVSAKVNLALRVAGRRDDGFHEVASLLASVSLRDRLAAYPQAAGLDLLVRPPTVAAGPENLVVRAAMCLCEAAGWPTASAPGVRLVLGKRIPVAAGLAGGSADAAGTLRLLNRLWGLHWSDDRLMALAATLGSDVPFQLRGGAALASGRGERLSFLPVATRPLWLVLAGPAAGVAAAAAYAAWDRQGGQAGSTDFEALAAAVVQGDAAGVAAHLGNDLQAPVEAMCPPVAELISGLREAGALGAVMTGSGPWVLGVCRDRQHARDVASALHLPSGGRRLLVRTMGSGYLWT